MANFTLTLTRKQFKQLHRVFTASAEAHSAGIHPQMPKRKGGTEGKVKAEIRHFRANMDIFAILKAAYKQAQAEQEELPEPLRTILAGLKEKGIDAKVERVTIQPQTKESERPSERKQNAGSD